MTVYFDNAATTALDEDVVKAMLPYLTEHYGNPSTLYSLGRTARAGIEESRKTMAKLINAQPGEITFTSSATEANNTVLKGAVLYAGVQRIITSPTEHHCVGHTVEFCRDYLQTEVVYVRVDQAGNVDLENLAQLLAASDKKTLVSLMHANNEIGTLLDIIQVGNICRQYGALFHSDTVQTFAHYPLDVQQLPVDFIVGSAHKFHGPKGIGFLYMRKQNRLDSFIHGGGQERGMRAGTENVAGIVGMATAAKKAYDHLEQDSAHILSVKQYFKDSLQAALEDIDFNGNTDERSLYTVLNVSFPPSDTSALLLFTLDLAGIFCSGGSACGSGAASGSHVIQALGKDPNRVSIRFSFSKYSTREEVDIVMEKMKETFPLKK